MKGHPPPSDGPDGGAMLGPMPGPDDCHIRTEHGGSGGTADGSGSGTGSGTGSGAGGSDGGGTAARGRCARG